MATGGNKGNLMILGDIGEDKGPKKFTETFEGDEAEIICHFFQEELKDIGLVGCIKREHGPVKRLIVEYFENKTERIKPLLSDLKQDLCSLPQKEISCPTDKKKKFAEYLKEKENDEDVLVLPDIAECKVKIIGKTQEKVDEAAHYFKVKTGQIKVTGRGNRQISEPSEDKPSYSSIVAGGNNTGGNKRLYPNIDEYKKKSFKENSSQFSSSDNNFSGSMSSSWRSSAGSSTDDFSFETKLSGRMLLKVYKASITRVNVDAIVNAANDTMMHGGGVARVISEAAGYDLDKESRQYIERYGQLGVGKNIVTTAGRLPYKAVIHAVGPMWHDYNRNKKLECLDDLYDCVWNILDTCKDKGYRRVAMSAISAGIFAVPKELCADMYLYAAYRFSKSLSATDCPEELHIIDVDTTILKLVEQSVKRWKENPESINQRITLPKYLEENPHQAGYSGSGGQRSYDGHRAGRRHRGGNGNQQSGRSPGDGVHGNERRHRHPSPQNENMEETFKINSSIRRLDNMKLRWGGNAKMFILDKQLTVMIYKGEISKIREIDAIVCGTGTDLEPKGFISSALQTAGGQSYISDYKKMKDKHKVNCQPTDVFKCKAGKLPVKYILHVVTSRVVEADTREIQTYKDCVYSVLKKARRNDLEKLAIPLFATGMIQTNLRKLKLCAGAVLKAVDEFLEEYKDKNAAIVEIHLVNNSDDVTDVLEEVFNEALGKNTKPSNRSSGEYKGRDEFSSSDRKNPRQTGSGQGKSEGQKSHFERSFSASGYNDGDTVTKNSNRSSGEYKARDEFSTSDRKNHGQTGSGQGESEDQSSRYKRSFSASGHIDTDVVTCGESNRGHNEKGRGGKTDNDENDHYDIISNVSEGAKGGRNDSHDEDDHFERNDDQEDPPKQETKTGNLNIINN